MWNVKWSQVEVFFVKEKAFYKQWFSLMEKQIGYIEIRGGYS